VLPLFQGLNAFLKSSDIDKSCIAQLNSNMNHWKDKEPDKTAKMILGKEVDERAPKKRRELKTFKRSTTLQVPC
jgi:hypothetical protein